MRPRPRLRPGRESLNGSHCRPETAILRPRARLHGVRDPFHVGYTLVDEMTFPRRLATELRGATVNHGVDQMRAGVATFASIERDVRQVLGSKRASAFESALLQLHYWLVDDGDPR